jgi:taurine dioxygenase
MSDGVPMKVERLSPHIGARVSGLDLRELQLSDRQMIRDLLEDHLVLFFTGQNLSDAEFNAYGRVVGDVESLTMLETLGGDLAAVHIVEAKPGMGRGRFTDAWHSDACYLPEPPYATTIKPVYLPDLGGDTLWASMYAAYELLAEPLRRMADELQVVQGALDYQSVHPVVRVNPRTGRRGLYVNSVFSKQILDVSALESAKLIDMFCALATVPDVQVRYRWTPDTVCIWDNRFTQHYAVADYSDPRRMHRLNVKGEKVLGIRDVTAA